MNDVHCGRNEVYLPNRKFYSRIYVLKCISAKIAETIRGSVNKSGMIFNPE